MTLLDMGSLPSEIRDQLLAALRGENPHKHAPCPLIDGEDSDE